MTELAVAPSAPVAQPAQLAPIAEVAEVLEEQALRALERSEETLLVSILLTPAVAEMVSWIHESDYLKFATDQAEGHINVYWAILKTLTRRGVS